MRTRGDRGPRPPPRRRTRPRPSPDGLPVRVDVLVLDGVFDVGLSAVLDTLSLANVLAPGAMAREGAAPPFVVELVGVRRHVRTQHGLAVPVLPADGRRAPRVAILPAVGATTPEDIARVLDRRDVADAQAVLEDWAARGARLCSACGGTFILAGTALLDGGVATTTWWLAPSFRALYPRVELDDTQMVVVSGACVTAGAALAHLDLALWLVRQVSAELATQVARYLVFDARPSPAAHAIPSQLAHDDPIVARFERWARGALARPFSLEEAARSVATSPRTLSRRTNQVLGKSPVSYVQDLRVERAVHLLQTTSRSIDEIAGEVGYGDAVTLRNLLRRRTGCGVRELRARRI